MPRKTDFDRASDRLNPSVKTKAKPKKFGWRILRISIFALLIIGAGALALIFPVIGPTDTNHTPSAVAAYQAETDTDTAEVAEAEVYVLEGDAAESGQDLTEQTDAAVDRVLSDSGFAAAPVERQEVTDAVEADPVDENIDWDGNMDWTETVANTETTQNMEMDAGTGMAMIDPAVGIEDTMDAPAGDMVDPESILDSETEMDGMTLDPDDSFAGFGQMSGLRAVIEARRQAILSSQLAARILEISPDDGERFKKGQTLVKFDCGNFRAQLDKARADFSAAEEKYTSAAQLDRMGGISRLDATVAEAEMKATEAEVRTAAWKVSRCNIEAPYNGRVVKRIANAYETMNTGDEMMSIVSDADLEVRVIVPSAWLRRIGKGTLFSFTLEETGESYEAEVVAAGAKIDPVSQTVEIRGRILSMNENVIAGMSGNALFGGLTQ